MYKITKKIISIFGILISIVVVPSWFYFLLPIRNYLKFGFWGIRDYGVDSQNIYSFPKFENIGISNDVALYLNFTISYLYMLSCFTVILVPIIFFLKRLIKWCNDVVWERKYIKKPINTWVLNLLFISTLIIICVNIFNRLLGE
ncbi:hypothetical protein [Sphingobacterium hungaricum]